MKLNYILVTGAAGFIGFHLCSKLLSNGYKVFGIDNLNDYYSVHLKKKRLEILLDDNNFQFRRIDITDRASLSKLFERFQFDEVIHLAAQAGVRYSIVNPHAYVDNNITGFLNILEAAKEYKIKRMIFASSSSVYGDNRKVPFSEADFVDHPISVYAATKKSNELFAYTYSSLYNIPMIGLRFFTVYGEWGRPDMAYYIFTKRILEGRPIALFNFGNLKRDFTYVGDIVEGISRLLRLDAFPSNNNKKNHVPYSIYNIGNNKPVELIQFVHTLEIAIGKKAQIKFLPMQEGDVYETYADISALNKLAGFRPSVEIKEGLERFVKWFLEYNECFVNETAYANSRNLINAK